MKKGRNAAGRFVAGSKEVQRLAVQAGSAKVPKGFATMSPEEADRIRRRSVSALTPEQRSERSRKAAQARWSKHANTRNT